LLLGWRCAVLRRSLARRRVSILGKLLAPARRGHSSLGPTIGRWRARERLPEGPGIRSHRTAQRIDARLRHGRRKCRGSLVHSTGAGSGRLRWPGLTGERWRTELPRWTAASHRRNADHRPFEPARNRRRPRRRCSRSRTSRAGNRGPGCSRNRSSARGRRGSARCPRRWSGAGHLRLIHHQHRPFELRRRRALDVEAAFRARLRRIRVLRATVRTEHSYLPRGEGPARLRRARPHRASPGTARLTRACRA
jgi:hypothetical protein